MHPISKVYFGDGTNGLPSFSVLYHNGSYETYGFIVKQLGTNKFIVSDGSSQTICSLSSNGELSSGLMTILINQIVNGTTSVGNEERVVKFIGHQKVLTNLGNMYKFVFSANTYSSSISASNKYASIEQYSSENGGSITVDNVRYTRIKFGSEILDRLISSQPLYGKP